MGFFTKRMQADTNGELPTLQERQDYLDGFRLGCPTENDCVPSQVNHSEHFKAGLKAGSQSFATLPPSLKRNGKLINSED